MANTEIVVNLGTSATSARQAARNVAEKLYKAAPTGDARGQAFKNEFVKAFLGNSGRAKAQAAEILGVGSHKPVLGEDGESYEEEEDDDNCCQNSCCK